jgi:aspartyl-tRNA(Asn)/glutamyl-tRNA(Gln) amidotransferase subunit C
MSISLSDVHRIARLARIEIDDAQAQEAAAKLGDIFAMIERISRVDTTGVAPMSHPLDGVQRLRDDAAQEQPPRETLLQNAPEQAQGLFLVPRVIE